ncbi:hypothetical protein [Pseudoalteromonas lipolytica]|uniref:hypothetical protein n=1 Tax=Pseudoalteromonas lipolytica TaxID=570156 RepID=UPI0030984572
MGLAGCHILKGSKNTSSRVYSQIEIDEFEVKEKTPLISIELLMKKPSYEVYIFHQHAMLLNLLLFYFFHIFLFKRDVEIVFDIHDLNEIKIKRFIISKIYWIIHEFNEIIVFKLPIKYITVSKGLARILYMKHKKPVFIYFNVCKPKSPKSLNEKDSQKLVYFGQLNEERLPLSVLNLFLEKGYAIDFYGTVNTASKEYLSYINSSKKLKFKGAFNSSDIQNIIVNYSYSLICIESRRPNIRFCCPNKLYQSLSVGVPCVVSNFLREVLIRHKSNAVTDIKAFLSGKSVSGFPKEYYEKIYKKNSEKYIEFLGSK